MAYIKTQKIVRDSSGRIVSGSASIIVTSYDPKVNYHAKKTVRERLGKVLFLSEDKKSGVFLSPTRGLVEYSSCSDEFQEVEHDDPRLDQSTQSPKPEIHTVFGDSGSASIIVTSYDPKVNYHAKKTVRERLGKVLFLSEDKKSAIFLSPTRGRVEYISCSD